MKINILLKMMENHTQAVKMLLLIALNVQEKMNAYYVKRDIYLMKII